MKKIIFIGIVAASLFISFNLMRSSYELWKKQDVVVRAQQELAREKRENRELKESLELAKKQEFIEEEARNKLFLVKEGEQKVVIPQDLPDSKKTQKPPDRRANWQKWADLFF